MFNKLQIKLLGMETVGQQYEFYVFFLRDIVTCAFAYTDYQFYPELFIKTGSVFPMCKMATHKSEMFHVRKTLYDFICTSNYLIFYTI